MTSTKEAIEHTISLTREAESTSDAYQPWNQNGARRDFHEKLELTFKGLFTQINYHENRVGSLLEQAEKLNSDLENKLR